MFDERGVTLNVVGEGSIEETLAEAISSEDLDVLLVLGSFMIMHDARTFFGLISDVEYDQLNEKKDRTD